MNHASPRKQLLLAAVLILFGQPVLADWYRFTDTAMTTPVTLELWAEDEASATQLWRRVYQRFTEVDRVMSRYREDSELSQVNRAAAEAPVTVSEDLFRVLLRAEEISGLSGGAFDISFASVGHLYDYREGRQPNSEEIEPLLPTINYRDIRLDSKTATVSFARPGLMLDLGGIAKGYAVDLGIAVLEEAGVTNARLSAGGDMRMLGDRRGRPWMVGVRDPRDRERQAVVLPLDNTAVSTSGDYERFFIDDSGERVHHILVPSTGRPAGGVQSVTVIGGDAMTTDALSTAVFVVGAREGLAIINRLDGVDAVIIDEHRKMHYSDGLMSADQ